MSCKFKSISAQLVRCLRLSRRWWVDAGLSSTYRSARTCRRSREGNFGVRVSDDSSIQISSCLPRSSIAEGMLSGHAISFHGRSESDELLLEDPVSEAGDEEETSGKVIYAASFEELSGNHVQYDTVIWVLISLLLVLACGVGIVMLLYLPVRRYVLQKDIASRRLYITSDEIVYKVTRPSILPLLGLIKVEQRIPLHVVIGIVIEQGCLQSIYGVHTFRIECIAHGKAAPVAELQFQGVSNPRLLRKVIILETTKRIQEVGNWKLASFSGDALSTPTMRSLTDVPNSSRWKSPSMKVKASPRHAYPDAGGVVPGDLLLHKIEEVKESVQKLGSMLLQSNAQGI